MRLLMNLRRLKIFEAVANSLSITQAANEIGISQPSVSKQLKLLEDEFSAKFHIRSGQGIKITEEGSIFLSRARSILFEIDELRGIFKGNAVEKNSTLTIIGSESPSASLLPQVLKVFNKSHPQVQAVLRTSESRMVEKMLLNSEAEIALGTNACYNPQIVLEPLRDEEVVAVVSTTSPLAKKRRLSLEELAYVPVVAKIGKIVRELQRQGVRLNIVMQCESVAALKGAVKAGIGLGFLYRDVVRSDLQDGYLKPIRIPELKKLDTKCFVLYKKDRPLSPIAKDFVELLRQWNRRSRPNELRRQDSL